MRFQIYIEVAGQSQWFAEAENENSLHEKARSASLLHRHVYIVDRERVGVAVKF